MKRTLALLLSLSIIFTGSIMSFANTSDMFGHEGIEDKNLTIESMLIYALQDEHLALATYDMIIDTFSVSRPFTNIMRAESRHISAIETLMNTYNISIPETTVRAYDEVIIPTDISEIYAAGVQAEIVNINLYKEFLEQELPEDVRRVFEALIAASESHQKAFERNLDSFSRRGQRQKNTK